MEENDNLFELVKRLDEKESRFIVQFANCGRKRPEKVLELFRALSSSKKYEQRVLEAKFTNLNITRFHLRQLIMRALRAYRDGELIDSRIRGLILDYEILYEKGLYDEAYRSLGKAQELAETHHRLGRKIEILQLQKHRMLELETKNLPELMQAHNEMLGKVLQAYHVETEMISRYHDVFAVYRTEEGLDLRQDMQPIDDALLNSDHVPFNTRLYGMMLNSLLARRKNDLKTAKAYTERIMKLWKQHPDIIADQPNLYKIVLANYAVYLFPEDDLDGVRAVVDEIKAITDRNFNEAAETFQNIANLQLLLHLNTKVKGDFDGLVQTVEEGLEKYASKINPARQFSIWYNLMMLYLIHMKYQPAKFWIDQILAHKKYQIRREVQYITRLLQILIYYELNILEDSDAAVQAAYVYFNRKDELTPFKADVVGHFKKLDRVGLNVRNDLFPKLYEKLCTYEKTGNAADILGFRVITAWAGSKVTGKSLQEMLQDQ